MDIESQDFTPVGKKVSLWPKVAAVAAIAVAVFGAGLYFQKTNKVPGKDIVAKVNDLAPGKQGATLTLSNGTKIKLTNSLNGQIASEAGVTVTKSNGGELIYEVHDQGKVNTFNTLSTAKGETYQVRLSDGTMVWLNAASSLTYASNLSKNGKRAVMLRGEGYFEVAKDKEHPFVVTSNGQQITVLGTHFNVNAYDNEPYTKSTLLEGSVTVAALGFGDNETITLTPGHQAVLDNHRLTVKKVEATDAIDWKNGEFVFDNEPLESILKKIARWYDVDIVFQGKNSQLAFWGSISRYKSIKEVMDKLELTGDVHFTLEGRRVIVSQ
ncbi:FecR family protein [Pedobacter sp. PWIIR3]